MPTSQTNSEKPVLLLDVDGVLNAFPIWSGDKNPHPPEGVWPGGYQKFEANGYTICFAPELCSELLDIHNSGLAEIRWLTTWGHETSKLRGEFGFPELEVVATQPEHTYMATWWKLPFAQKVYAEGRPLIWCDDDINTDRDAKTWLNQRATYIEAYPRPAVLPIIPEHYVGLTPDHITEIRDFCGIKAE